MLFDMDGVLAGTHFISFDHVSRIHYEIIGTSVLRKAEIGPLR